MSRIDRVIIGVSGVVLLALAVLVAITVGGNQVFLTWLELLRHSTLDGVIVALLLGLLGIYQLFTIVKMETEGKAIVHQTQLGQVRISLASVKGLVMQAVRQIKGIKGVTVVLEEGDPLKLRLELTVLPDHHIPQLTETVQTQVQDYVRHTVGISVPEVEVLVKGIASDGRTRVE